MECGLGDDGVRCARDDWMYREYTPRPITSPQTLPGAKMTLTPRLVPHRGVGAVRRYASPGRAMR